MRASEAILERVEVAGSVWLGKGRADSGWARGKSEAREECAWLPVDFGHLERNSESWKGSQPVTKASCMQRSRRCARSCPISCGASPPCVRWVHKGRGVVYVIPQKYKTLQPLPASSPRLSSFNTTFLTIFPPSSHQPRSSTKATRCTTPPSPNQLQPCQQTAESELESRRQAPAPTLLSSQTPASPSPQIEKGCYWPVHPRCQPPSGSGPRSGEGLVVSVNGDNMHSRTKP